MKKLIAPLLTLALFAAAVFATDTQFQTRVITSAAFTVNVKTGQYMTITNFTQQNTANPTPSQRGAVIAGVFPTPVPTPTPTATPTPTPTPTPCSSCTPTPTPTATPTPTPTPVPTPTPTPINTTALTAAISGASPAEFIKPIVIAGPAVATINPVSGATLTVTYRKEDQPIQSSPSPTPTPISVTTTSSTTTATSSPTTTPSFGSDMIFEVLPSNDGTTDLPSATPTATPADFIATPTPTPTAIPSVTPSPTPTPTP